MDTSQSISLYEFQRLVSFATDDELRSFCAPLKLTLTRPEEEAEFYDMQGQRLSTESVYQMTQSDTAPRRIVYDLWTSLTQPRTSYTKSAVKRPWWKL